MFRLIRKRLAIRSYVWKLSQELLDRFGKKSYYSLDEVTQACCRGGLPTDFVAYAHAIFCSRSDFDAYYGPLRAACTYDRLRMVVSRRFFGGVHDFNPDEIVSYVRARIKKDVGGFRQSGDADNFTPMM
jgi:hypothetical protein